MFDGLKLALALISGLSSLISWMRERQMIKAGGEQVIAAALRKQADAIHVATAASEAVRADLAAHPDRVLVRDEFTRDD